MAPILYPPKGRQTFTIKEEGTFTLTDEQRRARSLVITVEKVKTGFVYDYFNFSTPEPRTHWGYLQLMARDFVIETQQLEYRRQVVHFWDHVDLDPIEQLRCLVRKLARFTFDLSLEVQPTEQPDNAIEIVQAADFDADTNDPRIIPSALITSIWYKIDVGRSAFVTINWEGYAFNDCQFPPPSPAPSAEAPKKGESGPGSGGGGGGGGGSRDKAGPPSNQQGDNNSDSPAPTGGSDVPPSPTSGRPYGGGGVGGQTKVVWGGGKFYNDNGCNQSDFGPITTYIPGDIDPERIKTGKSAGSSIGIFCGSEAFNRTVYLLLDEQPYDRSYGPAKFTSFPDIISVEYIP